MLGSNLEDREKNLLLAIKRINEQAGTVRDVSAAYKTQPWGLADQPEFLNQAIKIETVHSPRQLLEKLQSIEAEIGRKTTTKWGPRVIDIDILFFGERIVSEKGLCIPHPGIPARRFALLPLCEIAPGHLHPLLLKTCAQLLEECTDPLKVALYDPTDS